MSKKFNKSLNFNYLNSNVSFGSISANTFTGSNLSLSGNITSSTLNASNGITAGNINFTGDLYKNGSLYVSSQWTTTAGSNLSYTSGVVVVTNTVSTNVTAGSAKITNVNVTDATVGSAKITNANITTVTAATLNLSTGITTGSINATGLSSLTNLTATNTSVGVLVASTGITTVSLLNTGLMSTVNLAATTATIPNIMITNVSTSTLNLSTINASGLSSLTNVTATNTSVGVLVASTGITTAGLLNTGLTSTANLACTAATIPNIIITNVSTGTVNVSNGITAGNINFTGDLYKNGSLYVSSQWTTTTGSNLSYTSGVVVITNNVITNVTATNMVGTTATIPNIIVTNISTGTVNASGLSTLSNVTATNVSIGILIASTGLTTGTINASNATATNASVGGLNVSGLSALFNATATNVSTGILNVTGLTTGTIKVTGISTLINVTATNISTNNLNAQSITVSNGNLVVTAGTLYASDLNMTGVITMNTNMIKLGGVGGLSSLQLDTVNIDGPTLNGNLGGRLSVGGSDYLRWENSIVKVPVAFSAGNIIGGNITTTTISAGTLSASTITGSNLSLSGNLVVGGTLTTVNITTTNVVDTNISAGTLTSTNVNVTTSTIATLLNTNVVSTNISAGTINVTGITSASAQITNANVTTSTIATARITSNLVSLGNSNTVGNIFTTGGNVGINTVSPGSSLHVAGSIPVSPIGAGVHLGIDPSTYAVIQLNSTAGSYIDFGISGGDYQSRIIAGNTGNLSIFTNGASNNGYVGINTATPAYTLDVAGTIYAAGTNNTNYVPTCVFANNSTLNGSAVASFLTPNLSTGVSYSYFGKSLSIGNSGSVTYNYVGSNNAANYIAIENFGKGGGIYLSNNGNTGISTNSPGYTLDVNGTGRFTGKLTITGSTGTTGFDTATNDQYADMRVIRNSSSSVDKDMYLQLGAGATSTLHMYSNNSETMTLKSGNVGISTTAPSGMLHLNNAALFTSTGNLTCTGDIISFGSLSDARLKKNIETIETLKALEIVSRLRAVTFDWREDIFNEEKRDTSDIGFIAQEVEALVPLSVSEYTQIETGEVYKRIKHERLIPYLASAIQHLKLDVENQKNINKQINDELQSIKDELQSINYKA